MDLSECKLGHVTWEIRTMKRLRTFWYTFIGSEPVSEHIDPLLSALMSPIVSPCGCATQSSVNEVGRVL